MGCGASKEDNSARERSDAIEAQLKKDRLALRNEVKMYVLAISRRICMTDGCIASGCSLELESLANQQYSSR